MSSSINPEYRLRNIRRAMRDLLMGRRLSADPERTGVVSLADFGKQCDGLAELAAESALGLREQRGAESRCAAWITEEVELAARLAALMETLPKNAARVDRQCTLLEEAAARIDAALDSELTLEEAPLAVSVATLARRERKLFDGLVSFDGRIDKTPPAPLDVGPLRRRLRRAILDHEGGPFPLSVRDGVLRFGDEEVGAAAAPAPAGVARSDDEPPEVKRALDLRETAPDPGLAAFLLVKAVDEALFFYLEPRLRGHELVERARSLPQRPGKRNAVRPEAVHRPVAGWDDTEAARAAEKLAARRAGPEWARIPRGAYVLRLFLSDDDELAADLLSLGRALRRLEKGEAVDGTDAPAERALANLIGLLG